MCVYLAPNLSSLPPGRVRPKIRLVIDNAITLSTDERLQTPTTIAIARPDLSKPYPKSGTVQLAFNTAGSILLARFESTPNAIHLFAFPSPASRDPADARVTIPTLRSILLHNQSVVNTQWNPVRKGSFIACCSSGAMYLWSDEWVGEGDSSEAEEVAECIGIPARMCRSAYVIYSFAR